MTQYKYATSAMIEASLKAHNRKMKVLNFIATSSLIGVVASLAAILFYIA